VILGILNLLSIEGDDAGEDQRSDLFSYVRLETRIAVKGRIVTAFAAAGSQRRYADLSDGEQHQLSRSLRALDGVEDSPFHGRGRRA